VSSVRTFAPWFVEQVGEEIADARDPSDSERRREHGCVERLSRWGPHGSESTASERLVEVHSWARDGFGPWCRSVIFVLIISVLFYIYFKFRNSILKQFEKHMLD
jgi:hypothetical protein